MERSGVAPCLDLTKERIGSTAAIGITTSERLLTAVACPRAAGPLPANTRHQFAIGGFSEVQLTTLEGMARNVSLFLRIGYVITERVKAGNFDRLTMVERFA